MNKILIWRDDLSRVDKIYLRSGKIVWRVIKIDLEGDILDVKEYEECPKEYIRDIKINEILNENT